MPGTRGVGTMTESEMTDFIRDNPVGVLSLVDGDRPYAVALEHYFDGRNLYFGVSTREDQRKINCIGRNASACYTIYESRREQPEMVKKGVPCRSVLIEGKITEKPSGSDEDLPIYCNGGMCYEATDNLSIYWYGGTGFNTDEDGSGNVKIAYRF